MQPILTREQMRAFDRYAIEQCAVPGVILMENAGRGAAQRLLRRYPQRMQGKPVVVVCGRGNNGGDGFVVARQLLAAGVSVEVFVMGPRDRIGGDARVNLDALIGVGCTVRDFSENLSPLRQALATAGVVVDALFGTGLSRPLEGLWGEVIGAVNEVALPVVALDIPSGIDADTGAVHGLAVVAEVTYTFGAYKCGLLQGAAPRHVGEVHVIALGVPTNPIVKVVGAAAEVMQTGELRRALTPRPLDSHKYRAGSVLVCGGSEGKTGAALLCADAALRAGAGVATVASFPAALQSMRQRAEIMTHALDPEALDETIAQALVKRSAVAIGPGLGLDERARRVCDKVIQQFAGTAVVDADAITHFAGRPEALRDTAGPRILTPHSGEAARLLGCTTAEVEANRFAAARRIAELSGAVVLLKGYRTLVAAPDGSLGVCLQGTPVLATAGSGDTLSGIIAALSCNQPALLAARAGCLWHALAGARWQAQQRFDRGMLASEICGQLAAVAAQLGA